MNQYLLANRTQVFANCATVPIWAYLVSCACSLHASSCQEVLHYTCQEGPCPGTWGGLAVATALPRPSLLSEGFYSSPTEKP